MDLSSLISGDNLFKYSFTLGIVMIAFAVVYPMEKRHELELERIKYREQVALISLDIEILDKRIVMAQARNKEFLLLQRAFNKLDNKQKDSARTKFKNYSAELDSIDHVKKQLKIKNASVDSLDERISALKRQSEEFDDITFFMKWGGVVLALFGFFCWGSQTFFDRPSK